jgi:hypothetical protein
VNSRYFICATRLTGISALGFGIGLALSACSPGTSSAASSVTLSASAPAATASADASGSVPTAGSGTNAAPENVNGQPPVLLDCEGYPVVEPTEYSLDCYDAINDLENLHWTKWGQIAVATGIEELNPCTAICTMQGATRYPVSIQVNTTLEVSGKPDTYVVMTISYAGAMPTIINGETGGIITQRQHNSWSERLPIPGGWDGQVN